MHRPIIQVDLDTPAPPAAVEAIRALARRSPALAVRISNETVETDIARLRNRCAAHIRQLAAPIEILDWSTVAPPQFTGFVHRDQAALARVRAWLDAARTVGATCVVVPSFSPDPSQKDGSPYAAALADTYRFLIGVRHEAEERGMAVWIDAPQSQFLLSPTETSDLLDRVASHAVGARLCYSEAVRTLTPRDWLAELGRRAFAIRLDSPPAEPEFASLYDQLNRQRYDGPIVLARAAYESERPATFL